MYPLIRIDKRVPDGSIWQTRWGYLLPSRSGWSRTYEPAGTRWSNPLGGWTTRVSGMSLFHPEHPFTIAHYGPPDQKRFYIDVAQRVRVNAEVIDFTDLFLDVLIDPTGLVTEKDEDQLVFLTAELRRFARSTRDAVRRLIEAKDELFDPTSAFYAVPEDALDLPPSIRTTR